MTNLSELETTPEVGDEKLGPAGAATLIADFVDVLIPGERLWPSASDGRRSGPAGAPADGGARQERAADAREGDRGRGRPARRARRGGARRGRAAFRRGRAGLVRLGAGTRPISPITRTPSWPRRSFSQVTLTSCARTSKAILCSASIWRATRRDMGGGATRRRRTCAASTSAASTSRATEPKPGA